MLVDFNFWRHNLWETNNCNTHIAQYLKKQRQSDSEIWSINRKQLEKYFSWKLYAKCGGETIPRPFSKNQKSIISLDQ